MAKILTAKNYLGRIVIRVCLNPDAPEAVHLDGNPHTGKPPEGTSKPESTEGGRLVSILKWPEGAPLNLG